MRQSQTQILQQVYRNGLSSANKSYVQIMIKATNKKFCLKFLDSYVGWAQKMYSREQMAEINSISVIHRMQKSRVHSEQDESLDKLLHEDDGYHDVQVKQVNTQSSVLGKVLSEDQKAPQIKSEIKEANDIAFKDIKMKKTEQIPFSNAKKEEKKDINADKIQEESKVKLEKPESEIFSKRQNLPHIVEAKKDTRELSSQPQKQQTESKIQEAQSGLHQSVGDKQPQRQEAKREEEQDQEEEQILQSGPSFYDILNQPGKSQISLSDSPSKQEVNKTIQAKIIQKQESIQDEPKIEDKLQQRKKQSQAPYASYAQQVKSGNVQSKQADSSEEKKSLNNGESRQLDQVRFLQKETEKLEQVLAATVPPQEKSIIKESQEINNYWAQTFKTVKEELSSNEFHSIINSTEEQQSKGECSEVKVEDSSAETRNQARKKHNKSMEKRVDKLFEGFMGFLNDLDVCSSCQESKSKQQQLQDASQQLKKKVLELTGIIQNLNRLNFDMEVKNKQLEKKVNKYQEKDNGFIHPIDHRLKKQRSQEEMKHKEENKNDVSMPVKKFIDDNEEESEKNSSDESDDEKDSQKSSEESPDVQEKPVKEQQIESHVADEPKRKKRHYSESD